ncbi:MAG TPA: TetR/AcrR family transcriptional regulator [Polyangiaceae bacterium]|jgi:AcrR family transcriptional regulator
MAHETDKAEAILAAALDLFVERGFHGTSVPSVADRAGVAAGTIYHYFASKEALVNALYKRWKAEISARIVRDFPFERPVREQFRSIWERMADFALTHPKELAFLELHHHGSYLDDESRAIENQTVEFGIEMVKRAQATEALKNLHPGLLVELVNGAFLGVFRAGLEGRVPFDRQSLMDAERCCWEAVRA